MTTDAEQEAERDAERRAASPRGAGWIFSPAVDLATFGGSAAASLLLLAIGWRCGWLDRAAPEWTWIVCVLAVDVAHVWSTAFRAYVEPREWR
ncbi:MAG TPA: hypothetical protein DCQ98_04690, partial [Planctomycetaceae bacterium]|nr:hypothetical protein [Planctomycetaceae bacterium]